MPATEKMHTENTESSFSVFSGRILQWPASSVVASNFGIEGSSQMENGKWLFAIREDARRQ